MINICIVEDDLQMAKRLDDYISQFKESLGKQIHTDCLPDAIQLVEDYSPYYDIIFLDIELPHLDGMKAAKRIRMFDEDVIIIFVTNMAKFATKGYAVNAMDYLLKPVKYDEFEDALQRALRLLDKRAETILVGSGREKHRLLLRNIHYVESSNHRLWYHLDHEALEAWGTISEVEKKLEGKGFIRCNVCYLVNYRDISSVRGNSVILHDGTELSISRQRKNQFMQELTQLMGDEMS